jgi:ABC-type multidrug transport system ATPase subunit
VKSAIDTVSAEKLVKMYGVTRALAGVDLAFPAGRVTVVEGPNGSGKSTLLALLAQIAKPTSGRVRYGSLKAGSTALRRAIGVLAHQSMLYPDLTGRENLALAAALYGLPSPVSHVRAMRERFDIGGFGDRPVRTYSRGQLQRVALARALLHEPSVLLLDEPSTGLDESGTKRLEEAVRAERDRGAVVVLVTHDGELAARLADARVRLARGKVVAEGGA